MLDLRTAYARKMRLRYGGFRCIRRWLECFMQIETTDRICPLCKREDAENKSHDSTRLCHDCRLMIETILPKTASSVPVLVAEPQYAVAAARRMEVAAPI